MHEPLPPPRRPTVSRFIKFFRQVPFERALLRKMARYGKGVASQKNPLEVSPSQLRREQRQKLEEIAAGYAQKIEHATQEGKKPKELAEWQARAGLLQRMREVGFKPHSNHLAAALVMEHGLREQELRPVFNRLAALNRQTQGALFDGTLAGKLSAIKENRLARIHEVLYFSGKSMDTREIAQALEMPKPSQTDLQTITTSLGILDLAGLTVKIPFNSPKNTSPFKWMHRDAFLTQESILQESTDWLVLQELRKGTRKASELGKKTNVFGKPIGSENGIAGTTSIRRSFLRLERAGLVTVRTKAQSITAELTQYANELLEQQDKRASLLPELATGLLGLPRREGQLTPTDERMLSTILKFLPIHKALQDAGNFATNPPSMKGITGLAREKKVRYSYVHSVAQGRKPFNSVPPEKLRKFYLPFVAKQDKELGAHFERIIAQMEEKKQAKEEK